MSPERIAKMRELAERGIGGEKENARAILTRLGIDWRKPKETVKEKVYSAFGKTYQNPIKTYRIQMTGVADLTLLALLLQRLTRADGLSVKDGSYMQFQCTEREMQDLSRVYHKLKASFNADILNKANAFLNKTI